MKILLSSYHNPHFLTITEYIENAIKELGHELIIFDDRKHIFPGRFRRKFKWLNSIDLKHLNSKLVALARETSPDLVIIAGGHRIIASTLQSLKKNGFLIVLWTTDPPKGLKNSIEKVAAEYDYIFCQGSEMIEFLSQTGLNDAKLLPMGCDPLNHYPVKLSKQEKKFYGNDISFVGSYYPIRERFLKKIMNFDLGIWGPGWNQLVKDSGLRRHVRADHTEPSKWLKIYSASKIILSVHYQNANGDVPVYQASPRVFEALACGGFVLSDDQRDVFKFFKDGVHLGRFNQPDELVEKVQYYLNHTDERRKIAKNGRRTVLESHTYVKRVEELLATIFPTILPKN